MAPSNDQEVVGQHGGADQQLEALAAFQAACTRAKIADFRVHDLRHTFASWLVQGGVPLLEVAKLLGHSTIEMTERYAHLAPENLEGRGRRFGPATIWLR